MAERKRLKRPKKNRAPKPWQNVVPRLIAASDEPAALQRFRYVLEWIERDLRRRSIRLCFRDPDLPSDSICGPSSRVEWGHTVNDDPKGPPRARRVWINPRLYSQSEVECLWSMIHEYGHVLQGPPDKNGETLAREKDAWDRGWDALCKQFPELGPHESDYRRSSDFAIASYKTPLPPPDQD